MRKFLVICLFQFMACGFILAQDIKNNPGSNHGNKFEQIRYHVAYAKRIPYGQRRTGPQILAATCDYDIKAELDEKALKLTGNETITYYNNSRMCLLISGCS